MSFGFSVGRFVLNFLGLGRKNVAFVAEALAHFFVGRRVGGCETCKPVDVAVEQTKSRGDQNSIVNIPVVGAGLAGYCYVFH